MEPYYIGEEIEFKSLRGHWKAGVIKAPSNGVYAVFCPADNLTFIRGESSIRKLSVAEDKDK